MVAMLKCLLSPLSLHLLQFGEGTQITTGSKIAETEQHYTIVLSDLSFRETLCHPYHLYPINELTFSLHYWNDCVKNVL